MSGVDPVVVLGTAFCKKAGIDPKQVTALDIHLAIGEPATVTIRSYIGPGEVDLAAEVQRFKFLRIDELVEAGAPS